MTSDDELAMYRGFDLPETGVLDGVSATVIGGDGREVEYVRGLLADGATVSACGCPPEAGEVLGHPQTGSPKEAIEGADVVLSGVVIIGDDGLIYAPEWEGELHQSAFEHIEPGGRLYIGTTTPAIDGYAAERGFVVVEYGEDDELMLLRAPTIAEGAIQIAIEHTAISIHDAQATVVGFGRMGFTMARTLGALGAHVTVVARDRAQLARAREIGAQPVHLDHLEAVVAGTDIVFNTVPAPLLDGAMLQRMDRVHVIVDLASVPGGTDFDAAAELGIDAILARGLGGRAPQTAGRSQWYGIRRMIVEDLDLADEA